MKENTFYIGDQIQYGQQIGKILDITDFLGIFVEFEKPLMSDLGFETNRLWIKNNTLQIYKPKYGFEQYGTRKDQPFVKLHFN